ncbi:hypothetical protein ACIRRH_06160 [Kitasatospora sp. NPDC101235]|uniref:hypothetical protein n=1 Tax=Kitasatospora sp. NPDC101235 TaxID=3364101 RepID=UPI00380DC099
MSVIRTAIAPTSWRKVSFHFAPSSQAGSTGRSDRTIRSSVGDEAVELACLHALKERADTGTGVLFDTYAASFDAVWSAARPVEEN